MTTVSPKVKGLLAAIKGQQATVGNPAEQAAMGNQVTSMQNQMASAPHPPVPEGPDPHLISAIAKVKQAHGIPLEQHESAALGIPHVEPHIVAFSPDDVKNAIEFGMSQGHPPEHILAHVHMMVSGHKK